MLSVILANSVTLGANCEPFCITLTYAGNPTDYWILRGELAGNYGTLTNQEFIDLRTRYDENQLPESWETIAAEITAARAAQLTNTGAYDA